MAISTPSETIVSLEDPAALQAALQSGSFTRLTTSTSSPASLTTSAAESTVPLDTTSDPFITTTSDVAVVPVADGTSTQNITFTTGADRSVVIAGITTDQTSTAIVDSVAIYNTDKEIYVTGIDQSTTQNIVYGLGSNYVLPAATTSTLGGVIVDGTTILVEANGMISAAPGGYTLPTASTTVLGGVKIDGSTININGDGVITANGVVNSVDVSGGNTGLTTTGGPIQTSGVITLGGVLNVAHGGTGQTSFASGYLTSNGTALTSVATIPGSAITGNISGNAGGLSTTLGIASGGTGVTSIAPGYVTSNGTALVSVGTISGNDIDGNISGSANNVTGVVPITNGGTGQTTKTAAFDALAPTTTTGDLIYFDGTDNVRLGIGGAGQVLTVSGGVPSWQNSGGGGGSGTVTSISVVSANGFSGTVADATTTPAITLGTTVTGLLKGNGAAISAAAAGSDYQAPITLTTTGSSGPATFIGNVLNIPQYTGGGGGAVEQIVAGSNITVSNSGIGIVTIDSTYSYTLPTASTSVLGGVKVDGTTIVIDGSGVISAIGGGGGSGTVTSIGITSALSGITVTGSPVTTSGTINLSGTLAVANGGTGQTTKTAAFDALAPTTTTGDLIYFDGTDNVRLGIGSAGQVLTVSGGVPAWSSAGTGTVTSVAFTSGLGGLTVTGSPITGSGTISLNGTLAVANGGTGVTTSTGTGSVVLSSSPVLVTPNIGTPSFATLTNATGLPLSTGVTGTLPIANGGTGQTTKTAAFDALSPTTTTGDLIYFNGTDNVRLGIGSAGQVLTVSGGAPAWANTSGGSTSPGGSDTQLQFNNAGSFGGISSVTWNGSKLALGSNSQVTITGGTSGQVLSTDGSGNLSWASAGGASGLVEQVVFKYSAGGSGTFNVADPIYSQTSGVTATVTDGPNCIVTFSFVGKSQPPKSIITYGQVFSSNQFIIRSPIGPSSTTPTIVGGGTNTAPDIALGTFANTNIVSLQLRPSDTGAVGAVGQRAWLVVIFGF